MLSDLHFDANVAQLKIFNPQTGINGSLWGLDVWHHPSQNKTKIDPLLDGQISEWIHTPAPDGVKGGLRLLMVIAREVDDGGHDTFEYPLSVQSFRKIVKHFQLPRYFAKVLTTTSSSSARFTPPNTDEIEVPPDLSRTGYVFKMGQTKHDYYSLALSYDRESDITYGMVVCQTSYLEHHRLYRPGESGWRHHQSLYYAILKSASFANHPLLVPILVCNIVIALAERKEDNTGRPAEDAGSQLRTFKNSPKFRSQEERDAYIDRQTTNKILGVSEKQLFELNYWQKNLQNSLHESRYLTWRSKCNLNLLETLTGYLSELSRDPGASHLDHSRDPEHSQRNSEARLPRRFTEQSRHLQEYVDALKSSQKDLLAKVEYVLEKKAAQVLEMTSIRADFDSRTNKQIADETRKDSSSMKAIALLTMFFLPATFVCALFATPLFDWAEASDRGPVLKPGSWIYLAVVIPLTAVTLGIWGAYMWLKKRAELWKKVGDKDLEKGSKEGDGRYIDAWRKVRWPWRRAARDKKQRMSRQAGGTASKHLAGIKRV